MEAVEFNQRLGHFLNQSVTPFHAVQTMLVKLCDAGYSELAMDQEWSIKPGQGYYLTHNDSALIAFMVGAEQGPLDGVRMMGAHTDSPCLKVKPEPELNQQGYWQLGVEVYGGVLLNPWFDRDLSLAGRVSFSDSDGTICSALVNFRAPIAVIPSLAIHLDRSANEGRKVNPQTDVVPLLGLSGDEKTTFKTLLVDQLCSEHTGLDVQQVLDFELFFYDTQPAASVGLKREFFASARLDNLLSCFTDLEALLSSDGKNTALLVCNDHEEVGSMSSSGAQGPLLRRVLRRLAGSEAGYARLIENSLMISTDNAHGVHPNYASKHDGNHGPVLNRGPVIKINANQRYATNSESAALFRLLAERANVPVQSFVVRSDMGCGSTIGPITASELGIRTVDVGVPTFAMHSIRELAGTDDGANLAAVLSQYVNWSGSLRARKMA